MDKVLKIGDLVVATKSKKVVVVEDIISIGVAYEEIVVFRRINSEARFRIHYSDCEKYLKQKYWTLVNNPASRLLYLPDLK